MKIGKALLFPPIVIMILLLPVATTFLVCSMVLLGTQSVVAILSYVLAAYTLTVWCFKIPYLIRFFKNFKKENRYAQLWLTDAHLRINLTLYGSLLWNTVYAVFQLCLGLWHRTFWYSSFAGYYICLAFMRFFLVLHTRKHKAGERLREELIKYRRCGIVFLMMNLALSLIVFFMVYWNRTFIHHQITTITMAAYTFTTLSFAIVNVVKYRKFESPVYSASKAIGLTAALVSVLTLESTMLTVFGDGTMSLLEKRIMLGCTGGVICLFIVVMAVYMIVQSNKKLKALK